MDHIINSAAKTNYMSSGNIGVPIVFRGPNGPAAGVGAQHSQVCTTIYYQQLWFRDILRVYQAHNLRREFDTITFFSVLGSSVMQHGMVQFRA